MQKKILALLTPLLIFYSCHATALTCAHDALGSFYGNLTSSEVPYIMYARHLDIFNAPYGGYLGMFYFPKGSGGAAMSTAMSNHCTENKDGSLTVTLTSTNSPNVFVIANMSPTNPQVWQVTNSQLPDINTGQTHSFTGTLTTWNNTKTKQN